jgi:amino acid transporter
MRLLNARGFPLAIVVLVLIFTSFLQGGISYSIGEGPLSGLFPAFAPLMTAAVAALRIVLLLLLAALWVLNRKRALYRMVIAANTLFTAALLVQTYSLLSVLAGISLRSVQVLLIDVAMMGLSNILIFSIWYWIIDPPGCRRFAA